MPLPKQILSTPLYVTPIVPTPMLTSLPLMVPLQPTPSATLAGSSVESGPFTFYIFVYKDAALGRQPIAPSLYGDLEGIGIYMFWTYNGPGLAGPVEEYWGTIPNLNLLNTYTEIKTGQTGGRDGGILLPQNLLMPGGAKPGNRIEIILRLKTSTTQYGVSSSFSLRDTGSGLEPDDISISAIDISQDAKHARQVLIDFFDDLRAGQYDQANALYGGSYDELMGFAPGVDASNHAKLWQSGCMVGGLKCLAVRSTTYVERTDDILIFNVGFSNPDGTLFIRQPCCGGSEFDSPIASTFAFRVQKMSDEKFLVLDLPVYVP